METDTKRPARSDLEFLAEEPSPEAEFDARADLDRKKTAHTKSSPEGD